MKGKKDFQNKIQIQVSSCRQMLKQKNSFLSTQLNSLKKKYMSQSRDFDKTFDIIVSTNVYIAGANDLLSDLTILQQNADLLFIKKDLPSQIQVALEKCFAVAKMNKQKDLFNLLTPIIKNHKCMTDIVAGHESLVFLGIESFNEDDVQKYYPTIKSQCGFEENQYIRQSLGQYSSVFQSQYQIPIPQQQQCNPQGLSPQYGFQTFPQTNSSISQPQHNSSNFQPQYNQADFALQYNSANFQPQAANFQPQTTNFQPQTANFQPQTANFQPQTANFQPQTANFQPQAANFPPQYNSTNIQTQPIPVEFPPQYGSANFQPQFTPTNFPPQYNSNGFQPQPNSNSFTSQYDSQNIQPLQPQNYENTNEDQDDDCYGLPKDLFVSVRPQAKE